ncbi:hypothetical protein [Prevotella sp.]|nr:hypothetical protein [Prevotella sp.]
MSYSEEQCQHSAAYTIKSAANRAPDEESNRAATARLTRRI